MYHLATMHSITDCDNIVVPIADHTA